MALLIDKRAHLPVWVVYDLNYGSKVIIIVLIIIIVMKNNEDDNDGWVPSFHPVYRHQHQRQIVQCSWSVPLWWKSHKVPNRLGALDAVTFPGSISTYIQIYKNIFTIVLYYINIYRYFDLYLNIFGESTHIGDRWMLCPNPS